ncbi:MAG: DNA cytosine methyltransferase [Acetanaerobacterium sp.]
MVNDKKLVIFSFFSGSGFLDLGFEKTGYDIEFVNEFSPAFLKAYIFSRSKMGTRIPKYGYCNTDINEYTNERKPELHGYIDDVRKDDCLVGFIGGPPCPDFSVGGKNKGRNGEHGKLSLTYVNLIIEMKPDFFLFENVKGLWRTARHRAFYEELKAKLHKAGYVTTERLTNALEFGVPQDRDRILLFGVKSTLLSKKHYKKNQITDFPWTSYISHSLTEIKNVQWPDVDIFSDSTLIENPNSDMQELTVQFWFNKNNVENHPNASAYFKPRNGLVKMQNILEGDVSKKSYKRLHRWRYSPTAAYGNNEVHLHPYKARRISASEAMAIQSLPAEFELPQDMSLSDMFKTIGNGVPFLLSEGIAKTIRSYLEVAICKE